MPRTEVDLALVLVSLVLLRVIVCSMNASVLQFILDRTRVSVSLWQLAASLRLPDPLYLHNAGARNARCVSMCPTVALALRHRHQRIDTTDQIQIGADVGGVVLFSFLCICAGDFPCGMCKNAVIRCVWRPDGAGRAHTHNQSFRYVHSPHQVAIIIVFARLALALALEMEGAAACGTPRLQLTLPPPEHQAPSPGIQDPESRKDRERRISTGN